MKIGIFTFHWATNYGAILQAYALQEYLKSQGNEVEIINYKPKKYDFSWINVVRHPSNLLRLRSVLLDRDKEQCLQQWRENNLCMTERFYTTDDLKIIANDYDAFISGRDQILNPSFTICGEGNPTSAYYLSFAGTTKQRIGYAVSFGCTKYPDDAKRYAKEWIKSFDKIGVRERTGLDILKELEYTRPQSIVPDPTILYGSKLFEKLDIEENSDKDYLYVYMLRGRTVCPEYLKNVQTKIVYADDNGKTATMERWLGRIRNAGQMITNSYHGMIMAILFHIPFAVLLETKGGIGMNDRFYTLLKTLKLEGRIVGNSYSDINAVFSKKIDWHMVDDMVKKYAEIGSNYLFN